MTFFKKNVHTINSSENLVLKVYPRRWGILMTVCLLNISNGFVWISYFPVANLTANYYQKSSAAINWFSYAFMIVPLLCFVITTYLSNRMGLKFLVYTGALFNFSGATIKALATSGLFPNINVQYFIALFGQVVAAVAQTFVIYVPTKVSQCWFPNREKGISTSILALSYSFGITVTQFITPYIAKTEDDIPTIDYISFGVTSLAMLFTIIFMTRSHPKTPPSSTAGKDKESSLSYWNQLREVFTTKPFVVLLIMLGSGVGLIAMLNTLTQQMVCAEGYSNKLAGSCIAVMYSSGYLGCVVTVPSYHVNRGTEIWLKMMIALGCIAIILLCETLLKPNIGWLVLLSYGIFGFSTTGIFPVGLELTVEATYPVDESLTTGLIYFIGQIFGILFIAIVSVLSRKDPYSQHNVCGLDVDQTPLDYSLSVSFAMIAFCTFFLPAVLLFKPIYKRKEFEKQVRSTGEVE